jgi:diguanylate cyclase (GGDEF)-like protein/PAS domain S-box-containing protein
MRNITEAEQDLAQLAARAALLEHILNTLDLPIARWGPGGRFIYCNEPYLSWAGRPKEKLEGRYLKDIYGETAWEHAKPAFARAFAEGETASYERRLTHLPHQPWARIQVFPDRDAQGTATAVYTVAYDIQADVERRQSLEDMRARLSHLADNIPYPLSYVDSQFVIRFVNKAYCDVTRQSPQDLVGVHIGVARGARRWKLHEPYFRRAVAGESVQFTRLAELPKGGRWLRTSYVPDLDDKGRVVGIYTVTVDVHELTLAQQRLQEVVAHDELTGALSRRSMMDRLELAVAEGGSQPHALFFVDLDGFKAINDSFGHAAGDALLCSVAQALASAVRADDAVARFGGDEFLVLARVRDAAGAQTLAQHLLGAVSDCAPLGRPGKGFGASIGYALSPTDAANPMQLLKLADEAMYAAKGQGKHRAVHAREVSEALR